MTTAVVIPVYNGLIHLQANLPSVLALKPDEIILVDDASADSSVDFIAQHPKVHLVRHATNIGFTRTVNDGFAHASSDIVFLLNQDVCPDRDLIKHTLPQFASPQVAAVSFDEHDRSWAKARFHQGFIDYINGPRTTTPHASFWASGGSAAFRRSIWNQLGGFDAIFSPGYLEDFDLGYRLHKSGYEVLWSPDARVTHIPQTSFNKTFSPKYLTYLKERNLLLAHWKNLDGRNLVIHILALVDRILNNPGFIVPTVMALVHLPRVLVSRRHYPIRDAQVFAKFV